MKTIRHLAHVALTLFAAGCLSTGAPRVEKRADFARRFNEAGVVGTFVLYDPVDRTFLVHNLDRAQEQFLPASTFKILNSLIALETGVVADTTTVFEWDGTERMIPPWNRDHTLASAFEFSVVWVYQEIARRIGVDRMGEYVRRAKYGNAVIGGGIDEFWLSGDLRISAMEQVGFLERLHERQLPFSDRTIGLVEGIMEEARGPGFVLRGKSGMADMGEVDTGWYVGYVVRDGRPYYFALEMDVAELDQIAARRGIAKAILGDLGLL